MANWRDLSVVLLAIPAFVFSLIPAVLLYLCVRGMSLVLRKLGLVAPQVQGYFRQAANVGEQASQKVAAPIIGISAAVAPVRHWRTVIFNSRLIDKEV